jgi:serine/threonine-protein kinase RIO1
MEDDLRNSTIEHSDQNSSQDALELVNESHNDALLNESHNDASLFDGESHDTTEQPKELPLPNKVDEHNELDLNDLRSSTHNTNLTATSLQESSYASLNVEHLLAEMDCAAPPEMTTPGPRHAPWASAPSSVTRQPSLRDIMMEQQQRQHQAEKSSLLMVELAQEEELIRIALERSLTDVGSVHSATAASTRTAPHESHAPPGDPQNAQPAAVSERPSVRKETQVSKTDLSAVEVSLIEQALREGIRRHQNDFHHNASLPQKPHPVARMLATLHEEETTVGSSPNEDDDLSPEAPTDSDPEPSLDLPVRPSSTTLSSSPPTTPAGQGSLQNLEGSHKDSSPLTTPLSSSSWRLREGQYACAGASPASTSVSVTSSWTPRDAASPDNGISPASTSSARSAGYNYRSPLVQHLGPSFQRLEELSSDELLLVDSARSISGASSAMESSSATVPRHAVRDPLLGSTYLDEYRNTNESQSQEWDGSEVQQRQKALRASQSSGLSAGPMLAPPSADMPLPPVTTLRSVSTAVTTASTAADSETSITGPATANQSFADDYDWRGAEHHLSAEEIRSIQQALTDDDTWQENSALVDAPEAGDTHTDTQNGELSAAEAEAIERALREADEESERDSLLLAWQMQDEEEARQRQQVAARGTQQGNIRTITRAELRAEQSGRFSTIGAVHSSDPPVMRHPLEDEEEVQLAAAGFRMNSTTRQEWSRRDQHSVVGPNNEVRTKHDAELHEQANAHRLGLDTDEHGLARIGNKAFNSFLHSVRRDKKKGVATHGTGRAGSDTDATKGGAMDPAVRMQITRAINSGLIERCNGVVKEGKEAVVYHAEKGEESEGFDVAMKVFKRIQEFKGRGDYVEGDPRYARANFRKASNREQLEIWAEKEFRNLMRAIRAGVPVPTPLLQKENVLFMRFMGMNGWPSPQLRELDLRKGSKKWTTLYTQVMEAIQRLYTKGRLVHGDLSEYNIMVVPAFLVDNPSTYVENDQDLQPVLIDFGQAVDLRHPEARPLLERDLDRVIAFFKRQGVETMRISDAVSFVVNEAELKPINVPS